MESGDEDWPGSPMPKSLSSISNVCWTAPRPAYSTCTTACQVWFASVVSTFHAWFHWFCTAAHVGVFVWDGWTAWTKAVEEAAKSLRTLARSLRRTEDSLGRL